jgi:hypothetical protein
MSFDSFPTAASAVAACGGSDMNHPEKQEISRARARGDEETRSKLVAPDTLARTRAGGRVNKMKKKLKRCRWFDSSEFTQAFRYAESNQVLLWDVLIRYTYGDTAHYIAGNELPKSVIVLVDRGNAVVREIFLIVTVKR